MTQQPDEFGRVRLQWGLHNLNLVPNKNKKTSAASEIVAFSGCEKKVQNSVLTNDL